MAYSTIDKQSSHFVTKLYSGTGSSNAITGLNFRPDFTWVKRYDSGTNNHRMANSVTGSAEVHSSNLQNVGADATYFSSFDAYGFTVGTAADPNANGGSYVSWNWRAGGANPTKTYKVVVVSDSGNKYRFRNSSDTATFGASAQTLDLQEGGTYTFDVSDSTVNSHPFVLGTSSGVDGSYSTGVTYKLDGVTKTYSQYTSGFSSATSRQLIITVAASAPTLYYNCSVHSGMGGQINTNSTFGSSNFDGTIKSVVSHNSAAGFSIIKYNGTGSGGATIGHELGNKPAFIMFKNLDANVDWRVYHHRTSGTGSEGDGTRTYRLNSNDYYNTDNSPLNDTRPGDSVVTLGSSTSTNANGQEHVAYCWIEKVGFSKFGIYEGNYSSDGVFVYTGFKPELVIVKKKAATGSWRMFDSVRADGENPADKWLDAHSNSGGVGATDVQADLLFSGFKLRDAANAFNTDGSDYLYMAWGQTLVGGDSNQNIPATAR